jgi:MFS family permease
MRGRVIGLAGAASMTASALGFLLAGWLSESLTPRLAVVGCAALSLAGVALLAAAWPSRSLEHAVDEAFNGNTVHPDR